MIGQAYEERGMYTEEAKLPRNGFVREETIAKCTPTRRGIGGELEQLRESVATAHEYMTMLEQRTAPFRRVSPQCAEKEAKTPRLSGSEFMEDLYLQNERMQTLCARLATLIDEIDL